MISESFLDELVKIAKSRMEKEISKGTIRRSDVVPGSINSPSGPLGAVGRKAARTHLQEASRITPAELQKNRGMSEKLFSQQAKAPPTGMSVHQKFAPMMGPATFASSTGGAIFTPKSSGQFMRTVGKGPIGMVRGMGASLPRPEGKSLLARIGGKVHDKLLTKSHSMDPSLSHAALRHEFGEAATSAESGKKGITPMASHLGPKPILEENMATRGDPQAQKVMAGLRKMHPDDALAQKHIKQMGGLPGRPLPIGGKHEKKLTDMLNRSPEKLHQQTRLKAYHMAIGGMKVPMVPKSISDSAMGTQEALESLKNNKSIRKAPGLLKDLISKAGPAYKFIRKGK